MHALHSFWAKPTFSQSDRTKGGWATETQHWCSWVLSCLTVSAHYPIQLITDRQGKAILIDALELPYQHVTVALDDLNDFSPDFWAYGKMYAYSLQNAPFFSLDADVFLWKSLPAYIENAQLLCQEYEYFDGKKGNFSNYSDALALTKDFWKPAYADACLHAVNAGLFGGNNLDFFKTLWQDCLVFLQKNEQALAKPTFNRGMMNVYVEQYLAACLAHQAGKVFTPLRHDYETWEQLFARNPYTHLMAGSKLRFGAQVEEKVKTMYPAYYQRVQALTK